MIFNSSYKNFDVRKSLILFGILLVVGTSVIGIVSAETTFAPQLPSDLLINSGGNGPSGDLLFNGEDYLSLWSNNSGIHGQFIEVNGILSSSSFLVPEVAATAPKYSLQW